ncbi:MAG: biotin synthase BioB [Omnitrophica WOR_2 bacterium GWA2_47_8]|nr:MAG: biotin synthase BioB [Omnitrophica WOR_2 bacterium GWA2_47_8]
MDRAFYTQLAIDSIAGQTIPLETVQRLLSSETEFLALLDAAFEVRKKFFGRKVHVHIINNAQNGYCPEDCHYCAQAKSSSSEIKEYPIKSDTEILAEAKQAYESGAFRYCMVFAGRGPSQKRVEHLSQLIRKIKSNYPIQVCVSAGLLDEEKAQILKVAGLDRLNHNLNTSRAHYPEICTTHTYDERLNTLQAAKKAGLEVCSGMIIGMGETSDDVLEVAYTLRKLQAPSIPVNFYIPIPGTKVKEPSPLAPEYCLRILCVFRLLNPRAEIRVAAGRELHLRDMEVMALYPANSLFLDGYLNAKGSTRLKTLQMIKDAGFTLDSEFGVDELLKNETPAPQTAVSDFSKIALKGLEELRPQLLGVAPTVKNSENNAKY